MTLILMISCTSAYITAFVMGFFWAGVAILVMPIVCGLIIGAILSCPGLSFGVGVGFHGDGD
jgi:hypothetical protein